MNLQLLKLDTEIKQVIIVHEDVDWYAIGETGLKKVYCLEEHIRAVLDFAKSATLETENFESIEKVIIALPSNGYANGLANEIARRIGKWKCWRVHWPEDSPSATTCHKQYGVERIKQLIEQALPYPVEGIYSVSQATQRLNEYWEFGLPSGESTGFISLDEYYHVKPGEWTLVTGAPGLGKSEVIDAFMVNLARNKNWNFAVFSPENQPIELHISKLIEKFLWKKFGKAHGMSIKEMWEAGEWIDQHFTFLYPEHQTLDNILDLAKVLVARNGIKGLVIDPFGDIEHMRDPHISESEYVGKCLWKIRKFARDNDIHIWLVAHPTKLQRGKDGKYPVATPYDVSGSAHFRNKADCCLSIWRDTDIETNQVEIHIQKIRFKVVGKMGMVTLTYDWKTGTYHG